MNMTVQNNDKHGVMDSTIVDWDDKPDEYIHSHRTYTHNPLYPYAEPTYRAWYWILADFLACPKLALVVAILAVLFVHFNGKISRWLVLQRGLSIWDASYDIYFTAYENFRYFGQVVFGSFSLALERIQQFALRWLWQPPELFNSSHASQSRRLAILRRHVSTIPDLESFEMTNENEEKNADTTYIDSMADSNCRRIENSRASKLKSQVNDSYEFPTSRLSGKFPCELEPAFLKDSDYPEGWMVFHPLLGVVLKQEADKFDQRLIGNKETTRPLNLASDCKSSNGLLDNTESMVAASATAVGPLPISTHVGSMQNVQARVDGEQNGFEDSPCAHGSMPVWRSIAAGG